MFSFSRDCWGGKGGGGQGGNMCMVNKSGQNEGF